MREILISWCCLLLLSSFAYAGVCIDDFEDGSANGWNEVSGIWEVQDSSYVMLEQDENTQEIARTIIESPWDFADGTIEVTITFDPRGDRTEIPTVLYRMMDESNGYAFRIRSDRLEVGKFIDGQWVDIRGDAAEINTDRPCQIKLVVEGIFTKIYYNGEIKARVGDLADSFKKGKIGFAVFDPGEPVSFDDIVITGEGVSPISGLRPVKPAGKLALVWGKVKRD